jgi:hypothetical protein
VETVVWKDVWDGRVHSVYGAKGSGKSAIYANLKARDQELRRRNIILIPAENPTGNPVFQDLPDDENLENEDVFVNLWALYFLTLIAARLREQHLAKDADSRETIQTLEQLQLLPPNTGASLGEFLHRALTYVLASVSEFGVKALLPPVQVYLVFRPPKPAEAKEGAVFINAFYERLGRALRRHHSKVWLAIDRLDVAFVSNPEREGRALRALFRTAMMLRSANFSTELKIFMRTDVWDRITQQRLPEASAIERAELAWSEDGIMDLITRRLLANRRLCREFKVNEKQVLSSIKLRSELFHQVFTPTMDSPGGTKPTFQWLLSQLRDGTGNIAPRDAILFLKAARQVQLVRHQYGTADATGSQLFDRETLVVAMAEVSRARLEQTLYAEYPAQRAYVDVLRGREPALPLGDLARLWEEPLIQARQHAEYLAYLGFFERNSTDGIYRVPLIYQPVLHMEDLTSGSAG